MSACAWPASSRQAANPAASTDLAQLRVPTLILQCSDDVIAPEPVGRYVHEHVLGSILTLMQARGHCPNLSAPAETIAAIQGFPAAAAAQR